MPVENAGMIESALLASLPREGLPSEEQVKDLASRLRLAFPISDDEFEHLLKRLHARLAITMDVGVALLEGDHSPWLSARKPSIDPFYSDRFSRWLQRLRWPTGVIQTLDRVTDEVLDLLGNSEQLGPWRRRGLVMGHVQSGKTATYTALSCKAADAGYRLIILLTGTLENLRRQTQVRLDEGFVGLDSSEILTQQRQTRPNRAVGVGTIDARRAAGVFTSRTRDFSRNLVNALGFRLAAFSDPVLLVVKKNRHILENLTNWLSTFNADRTGMIDAPLLLIDDEADSASINTAEAGSDPTAINERIRSLLALFTRSSYLGFTATPFANIFIDPENEHQMLGQDLFPRDFIYSLEPPSNYIGPQQYFDEEVASSTLKSIDDAEISLPSRHRASHVVTDLPESLRHAARCFLLASTLRDLRDEGPTHRSMLVNVSRFTAVQDQVSVMMDAELRAAQQDIRNFSQLRPAEALRNRTIAALHQTWEREYQGAGCDWPDVQRALLQSTLPIVVKAVNQRTGAASLDYASHRETGLRVIAVGGNSLSRGLTLEGLCTSYFYRNSEMYDTLLQMGRWFGYRDGYADLCRLFLTQQAAHWYAHITSATDELREELRRMKGRGATPKDFGLKVRAHPDSLIVTARNKMRLAQTIERVISISGQGLETPRLTTDPQVIRNNASAAREFFESLARTGVKQERSPWGNAIWTGVPRRHVAGLLSRFDSHPLHMAFQPREIARFLETTDEERLQFWDVVLPGGSERETDFAGMRVQPARRAVEIDAAAKAILVSGSSRRVGSRGVEREGIPYDTVRAVEEKYRAAKGDKSIPDREYRKVRPHPLLLVYVINAYDKEVRYETGGDPLIALGLSLPEFDDSDVARRVTYRVNLIEWRALFEAETDDDQPEDLDNAN